MINIATLQATFMAVCVTLFCREGCRPCDLVTPAFQKALESGRYSVPLRIRKHMADDDDEPPVQHFPTLALTDADGGLARLKNKELATPPLIGGAAIRKGLDAFLASHARPIPLEFDAEF